MNKTEEDILPLQKKISRITKEIAANIINNQLITMNALLEERQLLMKELISYANDNNTKSIVDFLSEIHEVDQGNMEILKEKRSLAQKSAAQVKKLKEYLE